MSFSSSRVIIPEEILVEILVRLPANSLMRFKCVSKLWFSLISSRYFTNLFFKFSSSTNPKRHVFVHLNHRYLYSSSLCNLNAKSSFLGINHQGLDLTLLGNRIENGECGYHTPLYFLNAIKGLMCFRDERFHPSSLRIINFTTRQILILPQIESNILMKSDDGVIGCRPHMWNYLGYDRVNDEYKVLSTISKVTKVEEEMSVRSETQVLVLGAGASWRNTKSLITPPPHHPPHRCYPDEGGISINGVLYYGAFSHEIMNVFVLMSFDFSSEDYNLIKFPQDYNLIKFPLDTHNYIMANGDYYELVKLMNCQDQVAVFDDSRLNTECILDLWVLEDAGKSKWSHKFFGLPFHELRRTLHNGYSIKIKGTSRSGEITLCNTFGREKKINHIIYDLERNHITRVVCLEPLFYFQIGWLEMNIWEDVESIMYLEP